MILSHIYGQFLKHFCFHKYMFTYVHAELYKTYSISLFVIPKQCVCLPMYLLRTLIRCTEFQLKCYRVYVQLASDIIVKTLFIRSFSAITSTHTHTRMKMKKQSQSNQLNFNVRTTLLIYIILICVAYVGYVTFALKPCY